MEKEIEERRTIKVTITLDVPVGEEGFAIGRINRLFNEYISDDEALLDHRVKFTGWDVQHGEKYQAREDPFRPRK